MNQIFTTVPIALISSIIGWAIAAWSARQARRKVANEQADRLEIHKDEITFDLMKEMRDQLVDARGEMEELRDEVRTLRKLETHFYHFQQSLEHLDSVLSANTPEERTIAERNARAFLMRMRRLNEAKGTISNEVQMAESRLNVIEKTVISPDLGEEK